MPIRKRPIYPAYLSALVLVICGIVLPEALGAAEPAYSARADYLSELGAHGAMRAWVANYIGFLPVALAALVLLLFLRRTLGGAARLGAVLIAFGLFVGYAIAFFFPCDAGCPAEGSARQSVHNLGGLFQYMLGCSGVISIMIAARRLEAAGITIAVTALGLFVLVGFAAMLMAVAPDWQGAAQRLTDYSMFGILIFLVLEKARAGGQG